LLSSRANLKRAASGSELPLASAAKVWPYTPIGTLVTVEK
jgi:hypothetical protein